MINGIESAVKLSLTLNPDTVVVRENSDPISLKKYLAKTPDGAFFKLIPIVDTSVKPSRRTPVSVLLKKRNNEWFVEKITRLPTSSENADTVSLDDIFSTERVNEAAQVDGIRNSMRADHPRNQVIINFGFEREVLEQKLKVILPIHKTKESAFFDLNGQRVDSLDPQFNPSGKQRVTFKWNHNRFELIEAHKQKWTF